MVQKAFSFPPDTAVQIRTLPERNWINCSRIIGNEGTLLFGAQTIAPLCHTNWSIPKRTLVFLCPLEHNIGYFD